MIYHLWYGEDRISAKPINSFDSPIGAYSYIDEKNKEGGKGEYNWEIKKINESEHSIRDLNNPENFYFVYECEESSLIRKDDTKRYMVKRGKDFLYSSVVEYFDKYIDAVKYIEKNSEGKFYRDFYMNKDIMKRLSKKIIEFEDARGFGDSYYIVDTQSTVESEREYFGKTTDMIHGAFVLARFSGKDFSMGFRNDKMYRLKTHVVYSRFSKKGVIMVKDIDNGLYCTYSSLETMLDNWKIYQ